MMCSTPWAAWVTDCSLIASPTTTWAPRTLNAAAFIGSRTRTRSWWPRSRILWATPRPTKPVEPRSRILATAENAIRAILTVSGRCYIKWIPPGRLRLPARDRRHRRRDPPPQRPVVLRGDLRGERGDRLHDRFGRLRRGPAARRAGADDPGASVPPLVPRERGLRRNHQITFRSWT